MRGRGGKSKEEGCDKKRITTTPVEFFLLLSASA
jgi:hypothetical protein